MKRDDWRTPQELWNKLHKQYDFKMDCCAVRVNAKTPAYLSDFADFGFVNVMSWMNPPFSKAYEMFDLFLSRVWKGVAIYRADNMETKVWQMILSKADWVHFFPYRVKYEGHEGESPRFPSALIGLNVDFPKDLEGHTIKLRSVNKDVKE